LNLETIFVWLVAALMLLCGAISDMPAENTTHQRRFWVVRCASARCWLRATLRFVLGHGFR
jgi:hypothetical protein